MSRLEQLRKLAAASPNDPLTHYAIGLELMNSEQWSEATAAFAQALAVDADYTAAYYHKARAEIRAACHDDAKETLQAGIECAQRRGDRKTEREMRELFETLS